MVVFDSAFEQLPGTGQAAALMTDRGQGDAVFSSGTPDTLLFGAFKRAWAVRGFDENPEVSTFRHANLGA